MTGPLLARAIEAVGTAAAAWIDLVRRRVFENRSQAIQQSVDEKIERLGRNRLAEECAKLDPALEAELADEGLAEDEPAWPEY